MKTIKHKKSIIGWTKKNWDIFYGEDPLTESYIPIVRKYPTGDRKFYTKVKVTVEDY